MCKGDEIQAEVNGVNLNVSVEVFDRFKEEVTVRCKGDTVITVPISDVSRKPAPMVCQIQPQPKQKKKRKPPAKCNSNVTVPETSDAEGIVHKYFEVMNSEGVEVTCGETYILEPGGIVVAVKQINKISDTFVADCMIDLSPKLDSEVRVSVPVKRLVKHSVGLSRHDKSVTSSIKKAGVLCKQEKMMAKSGVSKELSSLPSTFVKK